MTRQVINLDAERRRLHPDAPPTPLNTNAAVHRELVDEPHFWMTRCEHCAKSIGEGLVICVGQAVYHGRKGSCRTAAFLWLTPDEQRSADAARHARIYWTRTACPVRVNGEVVDARCVFPPRHDEATA